jgi:hypothetical protein
MTRILTIIALLFATPAWAEQVLYCSPEIGTGLIKENGRWQATKFIVERFTVKYDSKNKLLNGLDKFPWPCEIESNNLSCTEPDYHNYPRKFVMNMETKRFARFLLSPFSYLYDGTDTDSIEYGICQDF